MMMAIFEAYIALDTIFHNIFYSMQQHFATNHSGSATKRTHRIFTAIALHEASQATLLPLNGHLSRRRDHTSQVGTTAGAGRRSHWSHGHTGGATKHHGLLTYHGLLLIAPLSIGLGILLLVLRLLEILLLLGILRLLLILLLLGILLLILWLLGILLLLLILWLGCRGYAQLIATTRAKSHSHCILPPTGGADEGCGGCSAQIMPTVGTEGNIR